MNLQDRINALETPAKMYLQNLYDAMADAFEFNGKTLNEIKKEKKQQEKSEHQKSREERAWRIDLYKSEIEENGQLTFRENELKLYRNQVAFANLIGIEFDDE